MEEWGRLMRKWHNKDQSVRHSDVTVNYLGYYTDEGNERFMQCVPLWGKWVFKLKIFRRVVKYEAFGNLRFF